MDGKDQKYLKDLMDTQRAWLNEKIDIKIASIEKGIDIAHKEMDRRLEGMNEFRAQLDKQAKYFVNQKEIDVVINKINEDIKTLREYKAMLEGKADQKSVTIAFVMSVFALIIAIVSIIIFLIK